MYFRSEAHDYLTKGYSYFVSGLIRRLVCREERRFRELELEPSGTGAQNNKEFARVVRRCVAATLVDSPLVTRCHLFKPTAPAIKGRPLEEIGVVESGEKAACCADRGWKGTRRKKSWIYCHRVRRHWVGDYEACYIKRQRIADCDSILVRRCWQLPDFPE